MERDGKAVIGGCQGKGAFWLDTKPTYVRASIEGVAVMIFSAAEMHRMVR